VTKIVRGYAESPVNYRARINKEQMMQDVVEAQSLEDLKIVLLDWIDDNSIRRHQPAPWDR
jgi:hypothetical protein